MGKKSNGKKTAREQSEENNVISLEEALKEAGVDNPEGIDEDAMKLAFGGEETAPDIVVPDHTHMYTKDGRTYAVAGSYTDIRFKWINSRQEGGVMLPVQLFTGPPGMPGTDKVEAAVLLEEIYMFSEQERK